MPGRAPQRQTPCAHSGQNRSSVISSHMRWVDGNACRRGASRSRYEEDSRAARRDHAAGKRPCIGCAPNRQGRNSHQDRRCDASRSLPSTTPSPVPRCEVGWVRGTAAPSCTRSVLDCAIRSCRRCRLIAPSRTPVPEFPPCPRDSTSNLLVGPTTEVPAEAAWHVVHVALLAIEDGPTSAVRTELRLMRLMPRPTYHRRYPGVGFSGP